MKNNKKITLEFYPVIPFNVNNMEQFKDIKNKEEVSITVDLIKE